MNFLIEILVGLLAILNSLIFIYMWLVIISSLLTFVKPDPYNEIIQLLDKITGPAYSFVKRHIAFTTFRGVDLSPLIIIIGLQIVQIFIGSISHSL